MTNLRCTQPHFVRCIIPNETKTPGNNTIQSSSPVTSGQVTCFGLMSVTLSVQGSWIHSWCCISCAATACWRASGSAERVSPTVSSTPSSNSGETKQTHSGSKKKRLFGHHGIMVIINPETLCLCFQLPYLESSCYPRRYICGQ